MITFISGAVVGAIVFGLVIRNNPKLAEKLGVLVDKIEDKVDSKKAVAKKPVAKKKK
jgi:hypothetical protein